MQAGIPRECVSKIIDGIAIVWCPSGNRGIDSFSMHDTFSILNFQLPENYNFEIYKTIWKIKSIKAKRGIYVQNIMAFNFL